ncbi:MAG: Penicillin-binding protein activator LpoB [Candidatus Erwinia impunctatus]
MQSKSQQTILLLCITLVLSGCMGSFRQKPAPVEPVQPEVPDVQVNVKPAEPELKPGPVETVPQPPKMQSIDWQGSVMPLVTQLLQTPGIATGATLLVAGIKNSTNGALSVSKGTAALYHALEDKNKFSVATPSQADAARQTLGLSAEDSLVSRSKAVGVARALGAQYVLYSNVVGDSSYPALEMQLLLVQTGEILWSGKGIVQE